ncbi:hypothetical protein GCM10010497_05020 [Streptomyces cinereoruber]|uniref:Secreted protein n=1 Tax=Streptomyces cinereoruber TaxID=67260 RepID=A0AAV4KAU7_9ACTN|nr:DUF3426 domain-containing protein [Streptomyces cinereoruber]MBB4157308.1 hypothetical protein [Streptomyces cinereoruber]MBY8814878.1 DUF3426 domain-containing protein [Streptomyces cinereoruber]NIH59594.1 hypothetical protein [Streptomyces cinereoruber]GGR06574.1 hypothetical protein GCM10010497_05020 [Streptomyces cinereoruber]
MNVRYARRGLSSLAVASMALLTVGCGADEKPKADKPASTSVAPSKGGSATQESQAAEEPTETLAVLKGNDGVELVLSSAERDAGGFLTIKGSLKNTSSRSLALPGQIRGDETEVMKHGNSLGGATLLDSAGKKRYYVLRDTDGRPLTTTGLDILPAGGTATVFMQFPAPPASTTEVSFQLPTFEPATLKLS